MPRLSIVRVPIMPLLGKRDIYAHSLQQRSSLECSKLALIDSFLNVPHCMRSFFLSNRWHRWALFKELWFLYKYKTITEPRNSIFYLPQPAPMLKAIVMH